MTEQLVLPGFADPPPPTLRPLPNRPPRPPRKATDGLFFAAEIDEAPRRALCEVGRRKSDEHDLSSRLIPERQLHVTNCPFGGFAGGLPEGLVEAALEVGNAIRESAFELMFDRVGTFSNKSGRPLPFVAFAEEPLTGFVALQERLRDPFNKAGFGIGPYRPHCTLLYDRRTILAQPIEPIRWTVKSFILIHSLIGQTRHIVLGRWLLQP